MNTQGSSSPPLWRQLQGTVDVLTQVAQGQSATNSLNSVDASLRPAVQALSFAVWRQLGFAQFVAGQLAPRRPRPWVFSALCAGLALLAPSAQSRYDEFTLVNQLVEAVRRRRKESHQAAFVNGCLRRFLRERQEISKLAQEDLQAQWNFPVWWIHRVQQDHPAHWEAILRESNVPAPMTLRVNARRTDADAYLARLRAFGLSGRIQGKQTVVLSQAVAVTQLPGFADGDVSVQDAGAQMAAELLLQGGCHSGARILDACAAPGGKTGHLLELSDGAVQAVEVDPVRASRIKENLDRLGLQAQVHYASLLDVEAWWDGHPFDFVLLDAPCSASGIVRRHPDVRWQRRPSDIDSLAQIQAHMLNKTWALVRPGGRMLLCTCSIFAAEGRDQERTFLQHNKDAQLLASPGHLLPLGGEQTTAVAHNVGIDHDGFFYALFQKSGV